MKYASNYITDKTGDSGKPVLNTADGIKGFGGDTGLYRIILQEYYNENNPVAAELKEKIDIKDYHGAAKIIHKIKSSTGSIGAKSLYESAVKLQNYLHAGDESNILKEHEIFQQRLHNLLIELENILKDQHYFI